MDVHRKFAYLTQAQVHIHHAGDTSSHYSGYSGYFGCEQAITVALLGQIRLPATFFCFSWWWPGALFVSAVGGIIFLQETSE